MKKSFLYLCICALVALSSCCTQKIYHEPEMLNNAGTAYAKETLQEFVDSGRLNGIICIYYKDGLQETSCIGYADLETKRPITVDDYFMQCSQTKGFCGVSIAMLVEEGKLDLDDPVAKYLPEFKNLWIRESNDGNVQKLVKAKNTLTVRMCLNHMGGFPFDMPNYTNMGGWSRRMPLRSIAATAAAMPIAFEPGTKCAYSNVGIDIAAAIVEQITGMRWEDFLQERVLTPLGMTNTTFWPDDEALKNRIQMYSIEKGKPIKHREFASPMQPPFGDDRVFPSAGAGLWTTARDQYKFYKMLMNLGIGDNGVRILKEETVKSLLAVSSRPKGKEGYSLGLVAPVEDGEDAFFGHGGAWSTGCYVNWHKRLLRMNVVQITGNGCEEIINAFNAANDKFFNNVQEHSAEDAYTGRMQ